VLRSRPDVSCICAPTVYRATDVTGAFVVHIKSFERWPVQRSRRRRRRQPTRRSRSTSRRSSATIGDASWQQRVASHHMLETAPPGNCCHAVYRAVSEPADWHEANGIVFDWAIERAARSERSIPRCADRLALPGVEDIPFAISLDATGMTVPVLYVVAGPGCDDETCASRIRVTYRFDRPARDRSGDRVVRSDPSWVGSSKNVRRRCSPRWDRMAKAFTRAGREIAMAMRSGSTDPNSNPALRRAIANARTANMPREKIENAIKKAAGTDGRVFETVVYEGYAPHAIAIVIETATDNPQRTVANVRSIMKDWGGSFGWREASRSCSCTWACSVSRPRG